MPTHFSSNVAWNTSRGIDCFVGAILIASALLKAASLAESATLMSAYGLPAWTNLLLVQLEVVLGVHLITGVAGSFGRILALLAFLHFACFSAYRALAGYESCGCFGAVKVHPWITFSLDLILTALLAWSVRQSTLAPLRTRRGVAFAMTSCLLLGGIAWGLSMAFQPHTLAGDDDGVISAGGLVIIKPEKWEGKSFSLAQHIQTDADFMQGDWIVLLYHHDCSKCQEAMPRYVRLADQYRAKGTSRQVLLVEVPPFGPQSPTTGAARAARLSEDREWFVQAPVEIRVQEGKVVQSSLELPALAEYGAQLNDRVAFGP